MKKKAQSSDESNEKNRKSSTVFVQNLPTDATNEENVFSQIGPIQQCFVVKARGTNQCRGFGYVKFAMHQDAENAKQQLQGADFRGNLLSVNVAKPRLGHDVLETAEKKTQKNKSPPDTLNQPDNHQNLDKNKEVAPKKDGDKSPKKPESKDPVTKPNKETNQPSKQTKEKPPKAERPPKKAHLEPTSQSAEQPNSEEKENIVAVYKPKSGKGKQIIKNFRLIVRNLAWNCTSDDLRDFFSQYGKVIEVVVPPGKRPGSNGGFGFVNFTCEADTARAVAEANGKTIKNRVLAVDRTVQKSLYQETIQKQQEAKQEDEEKMEEEEGSQEEESQEEEIQEDAMEEESGEGLDESGESDDDSYDEEDDDEDIDDDEDAPRPKSVESKDVAENRTLFIANLPFSATEEEIANLFKQYGRVKRAVLVLDKNTGEPRGTAFVQFFTEESAHECLEAAYMSQKFAAKGKQTRKKESKRALKDHSGQESDIALNGRKLIIKTAVSRAQAEQIVETAKNKKPVDKRNLHLAEIGIVKPEDPAAADFTTEERHVSAFKAKKLKLGNPNFFVSTVRLAVHGIPKHITEAQLQTLFQTNAIINHNNQEIKPSFKQVIIVKDGQRTDEKGEKISKGFGFVEFKTHAHAMTALQNLNNKKGVFPDSPKSRLLVEFAVENALKLQQRKQRLEKTAAQNANPDAPKKENTRLGPDGQSKKGRGQRQRERKRLQKAIKEGTAPVPQPDPPQNSKASKEKQVAVPLTFSNPKPQSVPTKNAPKKQFTKKEKKETLKRKKESPFFFTPEEGSRPLKKQKQEPKKPRSPVAKGVDFESLVTGYKAVIGRPTKKWDEL